MNDIGASLEPIVEPLYGGTLSYLHGPIGQSDELWTDDRAKPFPTADRLQQVLAASQSSYPGPAMPTLELGLTLARAANSLACVHLCHGRLQKAGDALDVASKTLTDQLNDDYLWKAYGDLILLRLVTTRYNGAVALLRVGDMTGNYQFARTGVQAAREAMAPAERKANEEGWAFLDAAIADLSIAASKIR